MRQAERFIDIIVLIKTSFYVAEYNKRALVCQEDLIYRIVCVLKGKWGHPMNIRGKRRCRRVGVMARLLRIEYPGAFLPYKIKNRLTCL